MGRKMNEDGVAFANPKPPSAFSPSTLAARALQLTDIDWTQDNAAFALAMGPIKPYVLSGAY